MKNSVQHWSWILNLRFCPATAALVIAIVLAPMAVLPHAAQAQTFSVIHSFSGSDGTNPGAGLTIDRKGNLYGTTEGGGNTGGNCLGSGCGTVFELKHGGSGWVLYTLYKFTGGGDGLVPLTRAVFGPDGTLYTTSNCCSGGAVLNLRPPAAACKSAFCPWTGTVIGQFGFPYGTLPSGDLSFDSAGNVYGTTESGGDIHFCGGLGCGTVYQLTKLGGGWTQNILYSFLDEMDGEYPDSGVILDQAGNLYGTAPQDGFGNSNGTIFELRPSGSGWAFNVLYHFQGGSDGTHPWGGLIFDGAGNLYGTAAYGGSDNGGTVFELSPAGSSWDFNLIYGLPGSSNRAGPEGTLLRDSAGNLYGTTLKQGAHGYGNVFKLTYSNGGWSYTSLYDFAGGGDGAYPTGILVMDGGGNLYGTTNSGGNITQDCNHGCGVVFQIAP